VADGCHATDFASSEAMREREGRTGWKELKGSQAVIVAAAGVVRVAPMTVVTKEALWVMPTGEAIEE
jgi:hypothetical protein